MPISFSIIDITLWRVVKLAGNSSAYYITVPGIRKSLRKEGRNCDVL